MCSVCGGEQRVKLLEETAILQCTVCCRGRFIMQYAAKGDYDYRAKVLALLEG